MTDQRKTEEEAAHWLCLRQEPGWREADQQHLDDWLAERVANKMAYWRLSYWWQQADRIVAVGDTAFADPRGTTRTGAPPWTAFAIAASIAMMFAFVGFHALHDRYPGGAGGSFAQQRIETRVGGRKIVPLDDGSRIELNTATLLRAAVTAERREVWLDRGEAYFEVRHSDKVPFTVHAGLRTITVLGTKFSVRRDGGNITVSVVEGRVRIDEAGGEGAEVPSTTITRGNIAKIEGPSTYVATKASDLVADTLAWRGGMLSFEQSTLGDVVAEFNRYNQRKMVISDAEAASIRVGGNFSVSNVDGFTRFLHNTFGLEVQATADEIRISS
ncbi:MULTISPECIES: FecR family protein [unclassified Sphingomonas]|uniref:FecR family protein n=1 Tax=unclassified Sphingomonas TaxID=196159 RepID=UPI0006FBD5F2|nr:MULTISPECIES: FecR domain-containing protein [unclassified Sphingomonas]KQX26008.1 hypothetical protein ASD17_00610 [Sphingomonas sp. Root1294]KQY69074.1 hypothetical protein ASD39_01805 [Sphingomonas sp. Root50]KRB89328.1 hypothetical protein ASE22_16720 [Sphingomonas sp. Root720]